MDVSRTDDSPKGLVARIQMALSRALRALQLATGAVTSSENYDQAVNTASIGAAASVTWATPTGFTSTGTNQSVRVIATISGNCTNATAITCSLEKGVNVPIPAATVKVDTAANGDFTATIAWVDKAGPYAAEPFGITATAAAGTITVPIGAASILVEDRGS